MNGSFLLDTNIVIALFAGDASVMANIAAAEEVFIPAAVIGSCFTERKNQAARRRIHIGLKSLSQTM